MSKFFFEPKKLAMAVYLMLFCFSLFIVIPSSGQKKSAPKTNASSNKRVIYGLASFYADKFNGRQTASGEIFSQKKLTCACNMLPLGTWIKVTNVRNGKSGYCKGK
jgi:rare lipoprotein A